VLVAAYGAVAGLAYGMLLDLWFWPFTTGLSTTLSFVAGDPLSENLHRFFAFWLATSLGFDIPRAIGNLVLVLAVGGPVLRALRRSARRAAFEVPVEFVPAAR
jgi:energy-coupling factor transport system substrate-specific component